MEGRRTWTTQAFANGLGAFLGAFTLSAASSRTPTDRHSISQPSASSRAVIFSKDDWLPPELKNVYEGVSQQALDLVAAQYDRGAHHSLRLHGDCHEGNVLWTDSVNNVGPHFVDFDDSRMGPAVQDFWMLLGAGRAEQTERLADLLEGYEDFAEFDRRELALIEPLRTLRLLHYSAWIARRWDDPAFPAAFPWFNTQRYWEDRILELREQIAAMQEETSSSD